MAKYSIFKETSLPGTLTANGIYLVANSSTPGYLEIYVTDSTGAASRRIPTLADVNALIAASAGNTLEVVSNIAARNALNPTKNVQVLVLDATGDATVSSGAATYVYRSSTTTWYKISEAESQDLTLAWANIVGKPTSSAGQIDAAVTASHAHTNKTQLDQIGQGAQGELTYNGISYVQSGTPVW